MSKSSLKFIQKLKKHFDCDDYKLYFVQTTEELRALRLITEIIKTKELNIYIYDINDGLFSEQDKRVRKLSDEGRKDLQTVLNWLEENAKGVVIFKNPIPLMEINPKLARAFKNSINNVIQKELLLKYIIISQNYNLPDELSTDSFFIELELPTYDEIKDIFNNFITIYGINASNTIKEKFISALQGLREIDILNCIKHSLYDGVLDENDIDDILQLKTQLIKKEALLEYIHIKEDLKNVGGMQKLKEWLQNKGKILSNLNEAKEYGVQVPKGILLFGMPGCGKSLVAKTIANEWQLPLFRLDMGMILGQYVGQSEENIRRATKIVEAVAPCVLWIDELEKAFAGISGDGGGSSDVMKRVFGSFLIWMQEKTKEVFVVATANNISTMPPEFLRKGRFDEIFFVDFPKLEEREQIIEIHLRKRKKDDLIPQLKPFAKEMDGYSGADIEASILELIEKGFIAKLEGRTFNAVEEMKNILKEFKPLSMTMKKQLDEMKEKLKEINAKPAS